MIIEAYPNKRISFEAQTEADYEILRNLHNLLLYEFKDTNFSTGQKQKDNKLVVNWIILVLK